MRDTIANYVTHAEKVTFLENIKSNLLQTKPNEVKPEETKPEETKPEETKPNEVKSEGTKPEKKEANVEKELFSKEGAEHTYT